MVVILALSTGARRGELLNLRWPQVDLARRCITLTETKNGTVRALPLAGRAFELLVERAKVRSLSSNLVFTSNIRKPWEQAIKRAGIEDFRFHDLRHSASSYLVMNGASLLEVAEILGHKSLAMVRRYAHLSDSHVASVVSSMNKKIFGV